MIAVCNSLSYNKAREESDIDLFIIARRGRIWTVRFFALATLAAFGIRPPGNKSDDSKILARLRRRDTVCISFILSHDNLNLERYKIAEYDPYLEFWVRHLALLFAAGDIYERFQKENIWAKRVESSLIPYIPNYKRRVKQTWLSVAFKILIPVYIGEYPYKRFQLWKVAPRAKTLAMSFDTRVALSDAAIKMHTNDRRLAFKIFLAQ